MVSLVIKDWNDKEAFLIIKIDLLEFAVPIAQVDGVEEFNNEFQKNSELEFCIGFYHEQNEIIPIVNLKKILSCPFNKFNRTPQSRILFLRFSERLIDSSDVINAGIGVDAIIGLYHAETSERIRNTKEFVSKELECFQIISSVEINSKLYPILDLIKLLDVTLLRSILEQLLSEKF